MLNIAVCDDSRTDVEMLESAFDKLAQYQFSYEVYFTAKELLKHVIDDGDRKSTRLNSSHIEESRMPSSA